MNARRTEIVCEIPARKYLTLEEAAAWLGVAEKTVQRWEGCLGLKSRKVGGIKRFKISDLEDFMDRVDHIA